MARTIPNQWQFVIVQSHPSDSIWYISPEIYTHQDDAKREAAKLAAQPHNAAYSFKVAQVSSRIRIAPRRHRS